MARPNFESTMDLTDVRRHHLALVLRRLIQDGPRSRADLAQVTGLTKATVSALVADLMERGLVEAREQRAGRVGRPATEVAASGSHVGGLGMEIGIDRVAACVVDLDGGVVVRRSSSGDNRTARPGQVLRRVGRLAQQVAADATAVGVECIGGAIAVPGLVDPASGSLVVAPNLRWFDADLTTTSAQLGLPADFSLRVDNEADLAALGELRRGAGRDLDSFVFISGGVGVGAGIVLDRGVVRGSHGFAGELGHVVVDPAGEPCACGARGCLETIAGSERGASPDAVAAAVSVALRALVHLLDPEAIVLGGTFADRGEPFAAAVAHRLHASTLGGRSRPCRVLISELGHDAALVGGASAALDRVLADPTVLPLRTPARLA